MANVRRGQSLQARRGFVSANRIHTVITLKIVQRSIILDRSYQDFEETRVSTVMIVDMAGNERHGKIGVTGYRLRDACRVGLSLSAFGNVITALNDPNSTHIPYRDSKITRLLQDSLGGKAITVVVGTVKGAEDINSDENDNNLSTVRYLNRMKMIENYPKPYIRRKELGRFDS